MLANKKKKKEKIFVKADVVKSSSCCLYSFHLTLYYFQVYIVMVCYLYAMGNDHVEQLLPYGGVIFFSCDENF